LGDYLGAIVQRGARWDPALFAATWCQAIFVFHADLAALYGGRMDFRTFRSALAKQMAIYRGG
jgi:hypothetical protein